ncbi:MAG TPA: F0F1 ATP synthase subunit A [Candidatus Saccharimonadales bacterium]|nr:F0F1 ATP synthase subunit A [Candidatus Saccharimonadales bacterium]
MTPIIAEVPQVSVAPITLFHIGPLAVTNSAMLGFIGVTILLWIMFGTVRALKRGSRSRFMHAIMWFFENLYDTTVEVIGDKEVARKVMPLAVTLLFFFLINNWLGILPIVGPITYNGHELFRGAAADMNTTFALAIISMTTAQVWAIKKMGVLGNLKRYIVNPFKDPLHAFEGALEIVAEFSRTLALSLRIFGNVFGGEVLLAVIAYLSGFAAGISLPLFYCLELFVGAVQAYVFFMLTIAFISLGVPSEDSGHGEAVDSDDKERSTHVGAAKGASEARSGGVQ